jgi:outer membrane receptor protein involved in Fe transport
LTGTIITEIEALEILTGVASVLYSSGGIAGAEGAVRLLLYGDKDSVENALGLIESIKGEPAYIL